ncbi:unnamed protein product [Periconia digitata]|uniref:Uncharacterized protein n=1 Tax=Periconia digitata TaxID=1303443 RepID=A0A9W4UKQ5_9PLEO|nr:unnamed protein product [Periconia digitata]
MTDVPSGLPTVDSTPSSPEIDMADAPPIPPTVNLATEIQFEDDDGTLPTGYVGTWRSIRLTISSNNPGPQCSSKVHHLTCGHVVSTSQAAPCGINCRRKDLSYAEFSCPS